MKNGGILKWLLMVESLLRNNDWKRKSEVLQAYIMSTLKEIEVSMIFLVVTIFVGR